MPEAKVAYQLSADMSITVEGPVDFVRERAALFDRLLQQRALLTVPRRPGRPPKALQQALAGLPLPGPASVAAPPPVAEAKRPRGRPSRPAAGGDAPDARPKRSRPRAAKSDPKGPSAGPPPRS